MLEALGKTSGRRLPIIIDTPLGRLDSKHRSTITENYFPKASHQVVLLSTDTEIQIDKATPIFKDAISKTYTLMFSNKTGETSIVEDYF
jgi:DNA sulfur modification protein DndD